MRIAVFPGSFDPVTLGHMDIIARAARLFDWVYVCAMVNAGKKPLFTTARRLELLRASVERFKNVTAEEWTGLLADYARARNACCLVKGVRNSVDFSQEYGLAQINRELDGNLETLLLPASPQYIHFSSSMAREMIRYGQPLERYLPAQAVERMKGWERDGIRQ